MLSLSAAFERELASAPAYSNSQLIGDEEKRFNETLRAFYHRYDKNGDGEIDQYELRFLLKDIGEEMPEERFEEFLKRIDEDKSGKINFKEFSAAIKMFLTNKADRVLYDTNASSVREFSVPTTGEDTEEEEEEEEIPEDLAHLPPRTQKIRILLRAGWMMGLGTAVVLLFSDPMVDVLNDLGDRFHINSFYIAFVLAPIASNASELIASINYATKKTKKTITISLGALEGAACMNNTFCLGIFLCLIFGKGLIWEFSAETIVIVAVQLVLFGFSQKKTHNLVDASIILALYPLSIVFVYVLENAVGLN